jgi:hypothetical protein
VNVSTPIAPAQTATQPRGKTRSMLAKIAAFEFRYQFKNPVFWVTSGLFFLFSYGFVASDTIQIGGGGNITRTAPSRSCRRTSSSPIFFMFVTTAFVANVIVRDDDTGYGPIVRPPGSPSSISDRPLHRRVRDRALAFELDPARHLHRLADALARSENARAEPDRRLSVRYTCSRCRTS